MLYSIKERRVTGLDSEATERKEYGNPEQVPINAAH